MASLHMWEPECMFVRSSVCGFEHVCVCVCVCVHVHARVWELVPETESDMSGTLRVWGIMYFTANKT